MLDVPNESVEYQRYNEIVNRIKKFEKHYKIGKDASGDYDMYAIEIGYSHNPAIMLNTGVHGSEWQTIQYALKFMEMLDGDGFPDSDLSRKIKSHFRLVYIPMANPYGVDSVSDIYAQFDNSARHNSNNVDLNRDFHAVTQSETKNIVKLIEDVKPFAFLDMHMFQPTYPLANGKNMIVGASSAENIKSKFADEWETRTNEEVHIWDSLPGEGTIYEFAGMQLNNYTPKTISFITELKRPAKVNGELVAKLSDEEIFRNGFIALTLFIETAIKYFEMNTDRHGDKTKKSYMRVIDLEGNEHPLQATSTNEYELNGNQSISFKILPTKVNKKFIHDISEMWQVVDHDEVTHKIIYLKKRGEGNTLSIEVKGIPLFFDDFDSQRIYEEYNEHMTDTECFSIIFKDSGYNFILNGTFNAVQWEGFGQGDTRLECFKRALERYKAEFRIVGNTVYIENLIGRDTQFMYRYRLNASNIVQENDASAYYTYAKGYGDYGDGEGGEDWKNAKLIDEYTHPLAKIPAVGLRHAPPIKNGNITNKDTMKEQLKILVNESLKISVSADIHDLRKQGYALAQPKMGDRVFLIDERIGSNDEVRVSQMTITRNWEGEVTDLNLTLGSPGIVKRHQSNLQTAISNITNLLEGKVKLPSSVYDARTQEAIKAMNNALTQLTVLPDGSLAAIDPDNPNYMVMLKSTGLFLSEDGGATPKQAIWGGGINASLVTAGTMLADRIGGGILQSLNGNQHLNLNTGEWKLGGTADIEFTDTRNKLTYQHFDNIDGFNRTVGIGLTTSINNRFPVGYFGTSGTGKSRFGALDDNWFSGFITNTTQREATDGIGNSVVGYRFHIRDKAVTYTKGWEYNLNGNTLEFRPINTGIYDYRLGVDGNRWNEVWAWEINGAINNTSTINAKMGIEDVDARKASDYFNMMNVKSYYYKGEDYTDKYKRRVSPIIEQLDPVLENLYKSNENSLDVISNFWLYVIANQHDKRIINERLEALEQYVKGDDIKQTDERLEVLEDGAA